MLKITLVPTCRFWVDFMDVKKICLQNVGRFDKLPIFLAPTEKHPCNVTVLVGNNGAGKTSLLKSLATSLSWFVARLKSEKGNGTLIPEVVINNNANFAAVEIKVEADVKGPFVRNHDEGYVWTLARARKGRKSPVSSQFSGATRLADEYRHLLSENDNASLPLIAFYPVERVVLDIPLKIKHRHTFLQIDGYDNSLQQGVDFRRFFEWFRDREDSENESGISEDVLDKLRDLLRDDDNAVWKELVHLRASSRDRQLTAVRSAIATFMPGFNNLKVRRKPRLHMSIDKHGEPFNVLQLSQGEKSLMALVGDIARRLAMMNPDLENPLEGDGIVLIDEVDMHLHPSWQRSIISRLTETFPRCQFILTTHSPLVISDCKDVLVYSLDDGELNVVPSQYGQDANSVLVDVMDTSFRNERIEARVSELIELIFSKRVDEAKLMLNELANELPSDNKELVKAKVYLKKLEARNEADSKR